MEPVESITTRDTMGSPPPPLFHTPRGRPAKQSGAVVRKPHKRTRRDTPIPELRDDGGGDGDIMVRLRPTIVERLLARPTRALVLRAFPRGDGTFDILAGAEGATDFFIATANILKRKGEEEVVVEEEVMEEGVVDTRPTEAAQRPLAPSDTLLFADADADEGGEEEEEAAEPFLFVDDAADCETGTQLGGSGGAKHTPTAPEEDAIALEAWGHAGSTPVPLDTEDEHDGDITRIGKRLESSTYFVLPPPPLLSGLDFSLAPLDQTIGLSFFRH